MRAEAGSVEKCRLPMTPPLLRQIRPQTIGQRRACSYDETLLWAAAMTCFFGFFRTGELTVPSDSAFNPAVHLAWGDVAVSQDSRTLRITLKCAKTDQYGRGMEVFIRSTGDLLCPMGEFLSDAPFSNLEILCFSMRSRFTIKCGGACGRSARQCVGLSQLCSKICLLF